MTMALRISGWIDALSHRVSQVAAVMVLLSCLISAGNAALRYSFSISSNAWLEIQWQMFAAIFLLGSAHVLKLNEHVRVDVFYGSLSDRSKLWVDVIGFTLLFFPAVITIASYAWPFFWESYHAPYDGSPNAGGLKYWPVKLLLPVGFSLLILQGISEFIKRIAALRGDTTLSLDYEKPLQ